MHGKNYGVIQTVSPISRDFIFLAIKLNCSDRFSSKTDISEIAFVSQMCKVLKKFTEGNARKSSVKFTFSGYADVIKYQEKPTFSCEHAQITEVCIISARAVIKL